MSNTGTPPTAGQLLLRRNNSVLLCIDLQERLMPAIAGSAEIVERTRRLVVAARRMEIPFFLTEQVPAKLGATVAPVREAAGDAPALAKATFSACTSSAFNAAVDPDTCTLSAELPKLFRRQVVLTGVESHVCVLQTALHLLAHHYTTFVVEDAVGSRDPAHKQNALRRIEQAGGVIVNYESVLFEWLEKATAPEFRDLSKLVK